VLPESGSAPNRSILQYDLVSDSWSILAESEYDVIDWGLMGDRLYTLGNTGTNSSLMLQSFSLLDGRLVGAVSIPYLENASYYSLSFVPGKFLVLQSNKEFVTVDRFDLGTDGQHLSVVDSRRIASALAPRCQVIGDHGRRTLI
jgi:hypothetical protein